MGIPLKLLTTFSILSLAHSIFSAYESTTLPSSISTSTKPTIPLDIRLQTLISTLLLLLCIVFSSAPLRPIRWSEWAARIEREGWDPALEDSRDEYAGGSKAGGIGGVAKGGAGNPYRMLEERRGFWDVRAAREEFAGWVREGGSL